MKFKATLLLTLLLILFIYSCDDISEGNRFSVNPLPIETSKKVLIEDFTGQLCHNCPYAAETIRDIQRLYGEDHIIAVAIHGGDLSIDETTNPLGLATPQGTAYQRYWGVNHWPCGMVDRKGILEHTSWSGMVTQRLQKSPQATISIANILDTENNRLKIDVTTEAEQDFIGKLQIWLTEDSVCCPQIMPDGEIDGFYLHRHVFRASVNASYGDDISMTAGSRQTVCYEYQLNDMWDTSQLYVVAFIYNDSDGVLQAEKAKCK